jgi:hypothetical protein
MLVVTDGRADKEDQPFVDRYLPDILGRGIVVGSDRRGVEEDHPLAKQVHSYRRAGRSPGAASGVAEVFAEVGHDAGSGAVASGVTRLLAGLPTTRSLRSLESLTHTEDAPIGTQAAAAQTSGDAPGPDGTPTPSEPSRSSGSKAVWICLGVLFLIVLSRSRRRRARSKDLAA